MTSFKVKLRLLNEFGAAENLSDADDVQVIFPYEECGHGKLTKSLKYGQVSFINKHAGEIEAEVSDFDVQGMPVGKNLNFMAVVFKGSKERRYIFHKAFHVAAQVRDGETRKEFLRA